MTFNYKELYYAVSTIADKYVSLQRANLKYLRNLRSGDFADNSRGCLDGVNSCIVIAGHDKLMAYEENLVKEGLERLTILDHALIKFFYGSALLKVEFPITRVDESMRLSSMRTCLDEYLATHSTIILEELMSYGEALIASKETTNTSELESVYEEAWLYYAVG
jgi:hypothetical protein